MAAAAIPTLVVGGWLGAGKTTLVNHLLRHAGGRRIAVLVNDFGEASIDADLIEGRAGDVLALAGGCVCCSFGADLVGTLERVAAREPPPEAVLIEASGVGLPGAVARSARLARGVAVQGVVAVADAATLAERAGDAYVGDTVRQQLDQADLLIVNQADRVGPAALAALHGWLHAGWPTLPCVDAVRAAVPVELILGMREAPGETSGEGGFAPRPLRGPVAAAERFVHGLREFDGPVDVAALAAEFAAPGSRVLRAKGIVTGLDGRRWVLHAVGRRVEAAPAPEHTAGALGRVVWIALRETAWPAQAGIGVNS